MGLVPEFAAYENAILGYQLDPEYSHHGFLNKGGSSARCAGCAATTCAPATRCSRRARSPAAINRSWCLRASWSNDPDLLLVGQPTRGVDIGAIEFIHKRLIAMRDAGKAVLLVSVELDEIMSLSDRILVMFDGTITGELDSSKPTSGRSAC